MRNLPLEEIRQAAGTRIAEGIERLRKGQVERIPGFDGEYGVIRLFSAEELNNTEGQMNFFDMLGVPEMETISSNREKAKDRDSVGKPDEHSEVSEAMQADPLNSETENTRDTEIRGWPDCETGECGQGETVRSGPEPGAGVCGALYCTPDRREGRSRNRKDKDSWSPVCAICWNTGK